MKSQDLRSSILQYATQGKLVPQFSHEEPANLLLEKIKIEKRTLFPERELKSNNIPPIDKSEIPFKIPESWCWARLSEISNIGNFKSIAKDSIKESDWVLDLEEIEANKGNLLNKVKKSQKNVNSNKYVFKKNNVMYGKLRPYLNKVIVADDDGYCTTEILPLHFGNFVNSKYAKYTLMSPFFLNYVNKCSYGVKMPRLGTKDAKLALFPLPPLEEQNRIVEKIEELFIKIQEYDILEKKINSLNNNFPINMEKSILQYAMRGKLVSQNPNDESVETLMMKVKNEKKKLGKKKSNLSVINSENIPFEIPTTWKWTKLDDISIPVGTSKNKILKRDILTEGMIPVITQGKNFIDGYTNEIDKTVKLSSPVIMFGDHTRNVKFIDFDFVIGADGTKFFQPILINPKYLYYWTIFAANEIKNRGYGRHYSLLKKELIPLPPLNEQDRIVNTVNALLLKIKNYKELPLDSKY
ncbi:restriction endonuclease subunit S [Salinicoccus sp. YB14-2]|uniref:restriction endonuclease subunit S n=1 Tax=Salinicoccus sp. YB14-2 TaxID=1572701 RepID=UPI00068CD13B|nr:restriction endonuclease subunit S [Salinicoccus sp. YB14-2]